MAHGVSKGSTARRKAAKTARKTKRAAKKKVIASQPGTTKLEKRLNYKGAKARAKKANKAAVKKASSVSATDRKKSQTTATASHNKRLTEAIAKYGKGKTTPTKVKTKRGTGKTYDQAWEQSSAAYKKRFGGDKAKAVKAMKDWNRRKASQKASKSK